MKFKNIVIIVILIICIILYFFIEKIFYNDDVIIKETNTTENILIDTNEIIEIYDETTENNNINESIEVNSDIYVYITGEIQNEGVLTLPEGSRIVDAINAAGGLTSKADISSINLVYILSDGMKLNIPSIEDLKMNSDFTYITMGSGDNVSDEAIINENTSVNNSNIVNINTATQTELETLPGIGPSTALNIINYRLENGKFSTIEDIMNVNGIGENKFNNIKMYITV